MDIEFVTNNPFKFSTGRTFDIICTTQAETDDTIRSLATSGVCHGFMDTWSPHGNLIKNTTGNTADFVIPYFNFGNNNPIEGSTHDTNWYDFVNANHPEWFLREKTSTGCNGRRIRVSREVAEELMDRGSVGAGSTLNPSKYVDAWIKELINTYQANNWDGVWADNVNLLGNIQTEYCYKNTNGSCGSGIVVPCNPRTGQNYTAAEWRGDTLKALKRARELLDPYNLFFMAQTAGRWWREYDETIPPQIEDLADSAYMLQIENFAIDYGDMLHTFVDWIEQMAAVQDILKNRLATVVFRTVRSNRDPTTDEKFFRDASWLLVKEFNMMQRTFIKRGLNALDPWWLDTNLGAPQGDMFVVNVPQATQVRRRNYQNGIVLVNPHDTSSYSITVDRSGCVDVQTGQSRPQGSTINMTPKKGVILKNCS